MLAGGLQCTCTFGIARCNRPRAQMPDSGEYSLYCGMCDSRSCRCSCDKCDPRSSDSSSDGSAHAKKEHPPRGRCGSPCDLCMKRPCMRKDDGHAVPPFGACRCAVAERGEDCRSKPPKHPKFIAPTKTATPPGQVIYFVPSAVKRARCYHVDQGCSGLNNASTTCTATACKVCCYKQVPTSHLD